MVNRVSVPTLSLMSIASTSTARSAYVASADVASSGRAVDTSIWPRATSVPATKITPTACMTTPVAIPQMTTIPNATQKLIRSPIAPPVCACPASAVNGA